MQNVMVNLGNMDVKHARLFLLQRRLLSKLLSHVEESRYFSSQEYEQLIGLQELCDHISDSIAEAGFPQCLMSRAENPDLAGLSDEQFDSITTEEIVRLQNANAESQDGGLANCKLQIEPHPASGSAKEETMQILIRVARHFERHKADRLADDNDVFDRAADDLIKLFN